MEFKEYYLEVFELAKNAGYTLEQVKMFFYDIQDAFSEGLTVQQCFEKEF
jgi:hypothetical protein